jgi:transcriptional regulator of arginine metabolism
LPRPTNTSAARGLLDLDQAGESLIVARTVPGLASAVAVEIDAATIPEIVGTIAGEDTIFIAVRGQKDQKVVMKKVLEIFE